LKKSIVATLAALGAVGAQAATVEFSFGIPLALTTTEISQTGQLGLFDSNLGVLTGATLTTSGGAQFIFGGTNNAAQAQSATITSSTTLSWDSSLAAIDPFLGDIALSATSGLQNYAVGETKNFGPFSDSESLVDNLGGILAALQAAGGGTFDLTCESLSGLAVLGGGGNISTTQATSAGCGATIVYEYTDRPEVPEPGSMALAGLALAGLAFVTKRRKA
jgi:hypothetical protein